MFRITSYATGRGYHAGGCSTDEKVSYADTLWEALALKPDHDNMFVVRYDERVIEPLNGKGSLVACADGSFEVRGYHAPFLALVDRWNALDVPDLWAGSRFDSVFPDFV